MPQSFGRHLARWSLTADGHAMCTHSSDLLPVRTADGIAAMLKCPRGVHERRGSRLMPWWAGAAAPVLAHAADGALLMRRAESTGSLAEWARSGRDGDATHVLCAAAARLHAPRERPPPVRLPSLERWFRGLAPAARTHGGALARAPATVRELLLEPREEIPLHGDLHHDNVLDFGPELGWLVIDPHGVRGERGFDYANLFLNPRNAEGEGSDIALGPDIFERRLADVVEQGALERTRLLQWILAYAGLSASWTLEDGNDASFKLAVATKAAALLDG